VRRTASVAVALTALASGLVAAVPAAAADAAPAAAQSVGWQDCGTDGNPTMQCAKISVPLDYGNPRGRHIKIAINRIPHTSDHFQGPLLVNPGGPGGSGLGLAGFVARSLPKKVASQYDVIGFDPRGVGKSEPALECKPGFFDPIRPDSVPHSRAEEQANVQRAKNFAQACGEKYGDLLNEINTPNAARDMDAIRAALGAKKINYFGYSYGTYLGAVYAKLFPHHVRRLVLDSIVDPTGVWYDDNIGQDYAFDKRNKAFMAWIAEYDSVYHLGTHAKKIEAKWYAMREEMRTNPAGGVVGAAELEDSFIPGAYYNGYWPTMATAFADYVNDGDAQALVNLYKNFGAVSDNNGFSIYSAVQCRDASWPKQWSTWRKDAWNVYKDAPFLTWNNVWYNAPCAFWPTDTMKPVNIRNKELPGTLLFQATDDAATPYPGGVKVHKMLKGSRLVVEQGGGNHGITLSGNKCLDGYLADYLADGTLPASRHGADAVCAKTPAPVPQAAKQSAQNSTKSLATPGTQSAGVSNAGAELHRMVGIR
jgi:pimeloyl-ACP methyl ester carboxylesterase